MSYAQGRYVQTACGKCGFPYPRQSLIKDGDSEGLLVCRQCYDPEHPQERPKPFRDPIALRGPIHNQASAGTGLPNNGVPTDAVFFQPLFVTASSGEMQIAVFRQGLGAGDASVDFETRDGTSVAGSGYESVSGTLTWQNGEAGQKFIVVNVIDPEEGNFFVDLDNPSGLEIETPSVEVERLIVPNLTCEMIDAGTAVVEERDSYEGVTTDGSLRTYPIALDWDTDGPVVIYSADVQGDSGIDLRIAVSHSSLPENGCFLLIVNNVLNVGYPDVEIYSDPETQEGDPVITRNDGSSFNNIVPSHFIVNFQVSGGVLSATAESKRDQNQGYSYP